MGKKLVLTGGAIGATVVVALYLSTVPLLRRLPRQNRVAMDGITTIADAVTACRQSHLQGWELVAYAHASSPENSPTPGSTPGILPTEPSSAAWAIASSKRLPSNTSMTNSASRPEAVFATRCAFPPKVVDGLPWPGGISGHAWLRVKIGNEERDVCSGSVDNTPGVTHFEVRSTVHPWQPWIRPFTHVGSSIANIRRDRVARHAAKQEALSITARKLTTNRR